MKKKGEMIITIISILIWACFIFLCFQDLFLMPARSIVWFLSAVILISFFFIFKNKKRLQYYPALLVVAILNMLGEVGFAFFYYSPIYDKILHFVNPIMLCWICYGFFKGKMSKGYLIVFSVSVLMALGAVWEVLEYVLDTYLGGYFQGVYSMVSGDFFGLASRQTLDKLADTMQDIMFQIAGSIIFVISAYFLDKKTRAEK